MLTFKIKDFVQFGQSYPVETKIEKLKEKKQLRWLLTSLIFSSKTKF